MIEDTGKIVNEVMKDKVQGNLIINNRVGGGLGDVHKFISFSTLNDGEIPVFGQLFPSAHSHAYGRL